MRSGKNKSSQSEPDFKEQNHRVARWLIVLFALLFIGLCVLGYVYYTNQSDRIKAASEDELNSIAFSKVNEIVAWRNERLDDGSVINKSQFFSQAVQIFLNDPKNNELGQEILTYLEGIRSTYSYTTFYLFDTHGNILLQDTARPETLSGAEIAFTQQTLQSNHVLLSDIHFAADSTKIRIDLVVPIIAQDARPVAVVMLRIDPYFFLYPLIQSWPVQTNSAETVLFRQDGNDVLYLNELRFNPNSALELRFPLNSPDLPAAKALRGQAGPVVGTDYRGVPVIAIYKTIPGSNWYLIAKEDQSEIFTGVRRDGWLVAIVLVFILLTILSMAYTLIRRQDQKLINYLYKTELEKQQLTQKYSLLFDAGHDIILVLKENGPIIDVNDRAVEAYGYSRNELQRLNIQELRAPEYRKKFTQVLQQTKKSGGRRFETVHQRKDGLQFPVEVSSRYFTVGDQGYFLDIIRDISERKQTEKAVDEANNKLKSLYEVLPVGISVLNQSGDIVFLNQMLEKILGIDAASLLQGKYKQRRYFKADGSPMLPEEFASSRVIHGEANVANVVTGVEKEDGSIVWTEVSAVSSVVQDWHTVIATVDITEKVKTENELKENLIALQEIINTSPLAIMTTDLYGNVTMWNRTAEKIFGWTAQEVLGQPIPTFPDPETESAITRIRQITHSKTNLHYEAERKRKDGKTITVDVNTSPLRDYRNKVKGVLAILTDVTEIKAVEIANQKLAEERYQLLTRLRLQFNRMPIGFILTDKGLNILDWNPQAEKIFGYPRSEVLGKSQYDLIIPPEDKELVLDVVKNVTSGHQTEVITHENVTKNGRRIMVEWHNTALFDENGEFIAIMAMAIDVTEKIAAERKLHESEERLHAFFDSPLVGIIFGDVHGGMFTANDELLNIIGYSRDELESGQIRWDEITPPEFSTLDETAIQQAQREGICTPYEKQYIRKDGERVWVLVGFLLIGEERENSVAFILDISERRRAEQALIESEADYRGLFTHMMNGLAFCKMLYENEKPVDFVYLKTNESFERITGVKDAEGKKVSELIPGIQRDNPELFEIYGRVASKGVQEKFETYLPGLDVYFSVFVYSPKKEYFVALFEDVSEQKRAEKEIQSKQELLNMTGQMGKIGGWEIDAATGQGSWTEEVVRIHDLDPEKEPNVQLGLSFYTEESRPKIEKAVNEAIELAKPYDLELEIISAKGVHKLIRTSGQPELVNGKVVRLRGIFQDITEIKKAEAEIKKLNDELEQRVRERTAELQAANQELEAFSYSVSHDLRAPIRAIDGFSQIIVDDFPKDVNSEMARYLENIRKNTKNMGDLVDDLLAFSRLGKQSLEKQTVDTQKLVTEVVDEISSTLKDREVKFEIGQLPDCYADVALLRQVFVNLVSNAVKFTRKCQNAQVEIGSCQAIPPGSSDTPMSTKWCYYVKDNGVGFDMSYYDKLFGVFQRLHRSEDYEGTGVGLAIVKRVVEKHGGMVWAESKMNQGATFYFILGE